VKTALITGIAGQDGAYLAELLLGKGYAVTGTFAHGYPANLWRLHELGIAGHPDLTLTGLDLTQLDDCVRLLGKCGAAEVYNLAGRSFLAAASGDPLGTAQISGLGAVTLLEAIRRVDSGARYFQAGSSEMYGRARTTPQDEDTPFCPSNPYATAKVFAHWTAVNYRQAYGIFAANGILFNHESPLRTREFVTRKISHAMAQIRLGHPAVLELGNLDAKRDWGYAREYVAGMWHMLQANSPGAYVLATGLTESIRKFVQTAAGTAGFELAWEGRGEKETGIDRKSGRTLVRVNPAYYRPTEPEPPVGNPAKAWRELGWRSTTSPEQLCRMMVEADIRRAERRPCA